MRHYTSVVQNGKDTIFHRYFENGERHEETVKYEPFVGVRSRVETGVKTLFGQPLELRKFQSISDLKDWKSENEGYVEVYGDINPVAQFIATTYPKPIVFSKQNMVIFNLDIEVYCERGFPVPDKAMWPVVSITVQDMAKDTYHVFGVKQYRPKQDNVKFHLCSGEADLLLQFVNFWAKERPDMITGWYIDGFDVPYLVNRIAQVLGQQHVKRLSPIGKVTEKKRHDDYGEEKIEYTIEGVQSYDYKALYLKLTFGPREQYTLDYIAKFELGAGKLEFKTKETRSLNELYDDDYETFIDYNIKDVEIICLLDQKLGYIGTALKMVYMSKCQFKDVYGTVAIWDAYLYSALLRKRILCPPKGDHVKGEFPGGWVEDPKRGLHRNVLVCDIASSYPNSIISYNMSPETIIERSSLPEEVQALAERYGNIEDCFNAIYDLESEVMPILKKYELCMSPNGQFFRTDIDGFIPDIVAHVFAQRKAARKEIDAIDEQLKTCPAEEKASLKDRRSQLDAEQMALKVMMNSLYGALSNVHFRYFDLRMAEGITAAGQVSVRGVAKWVSDKLDIENLYTDTDSIFLHLDPFLHGRFKGQQVDKERQVRFFLSFYDNAIKDTIDEYFAALGSGLNFRRNTLSMEYELLADSALLLEKKKYVLKIIEKERKKTYFDKTELKVKGIEIVRTSTPQYIRDRMTDVIKRIFETHDESVVQAYLEEIKREFKTLPPEDVSFPRGVKGMGKYAGAQKSVPMHVRAALLYNFRLKEMKLLDKYRAIHDGDKIKFTYVKEPNAFGTNVIGFMDTLPNEFPVLVDYDMQWEKAFEGPMEKIFEAIGWDVYNRNTALTAFFD